MPLIKSTGMTLVLYLYSSHNYIEGYKRHQDSGEIQPQTETTEINSEEKGNRNKNNKKNLSRDIVLGFILFSVITVSSGNFFWVWAWVYFAAFLGIALLNFLLFVRHQDTGSDHRETELKQHDRLLTWMGAVAALATMVIIGLDRRFDWSGQQNIMLHVAGLAFYILGNFAVRWSIRNNRFFLEKVRIREQQGYYMPFEAKYRLTNQLGYVGILLNIFFTPVIFGSLWALVPAFLFAVLYIVRAWKEDTILNEDFAGYKEYVQKILFNLPYKKILS